jgi:hypothetical protein
MLDKSDIDWLKSEFLIDIADIIEKRIGPKLDKLTTHVVDFTGEIIDNREERTLHSDKISSHSDSIESLDKRVTRLEKRVGITVA